MKNFLGGQIHMLVFLLHRLYDCNVLLLFVHTKDVLGGLSSLVPFSSLNVDFVHENFRPIRYTVICQRMVRVIKFGWERVVLVMVIMGNK